MTDLTEHDSAEVKFTFFYCMFSFWSSGLLVLVCLLSEGLSAFGNNLHSFRFLAVASAYELGKVILAKFLSGHSSNFQLKSGQASDNKPIKGPFLRKVWFGWLRLLQKLTPVYHLIKAAFILFICWAFLVFFVVCLGAPVLTNWYETGTFCCLLLLLTVYPPLITKGLRLKSLKEVFFGVYSEDSEAPLLNESAPILDKTLYHNGLFSVVGAWLGAFPIPLDWDRPWQVWPISCCLGAVSGHILANVLGAVLVWPKVAQVSASSSANKRKFL